MTGREIPIEDDDLVTKNIWECAVLNNVTNFPQKTQEPLKVTTNLQNNSNHNLEDQKVEKQRTENSELKAAQQDNKTDDVVNIAICNLVKKHIIEESTI